MSVVAQLAGLILVSIAVGGCGQKGPLIVPGEVSGNGLLGVEVPPEPAAENDTETGNDDSEDDSND